MGVPLFLWLKHTTVSDSPLTHFWLSPQVAAPRRTWTHSPMVSLVGPSSPPCLSAAPHVNPGSWPLPALGYVSPPSPVTVGLLPGWLQGGVWDHSSHFLALSSLRL